MGEGTWLGRSRSLRVQEEIGCWDLDLILGDREMAETFERIANS